MKYDSECHHRRSIRLKGYDYSQAGVYFVTIVTQDRRCLFGEVMDRQMRFNKAGQVAKRCWVDIPDHFPHVELDTFVVMPNHVHGIIVITDAVGAKNFSPLQIGRTTRLGMRSPSKTVGSIVRGFKIGVTKWFRQHTDIYNVWQRNYREHIIRNEESLNRIRQYLAENPLRWAFDGENPSAVEPEAEETWLF